MKFVLFMFLLTSFSMAAPTGQKKNLPVKPEEFQVKNDRQVQEKLKILDKKEEDCDDKARKPVEIKPESISLTGSAGCTLPE